MMPDKYQVVQRQADRLQSRITEVRQDQRQRLIFQNAWRPEDSFNRFSRPFLHRFGGNFFVGSAFFTLCYVRLNGGVTVSL